MSRYTIVIIEPSEIVQEGLKSLLSQWLEGKVGHCYSHYEEFEERQSDEPVDVLILNPSLLPGPRAHAARQLTQHLPDTVVVALLYSHVCSETLASFDAVIDIYDKPDQVMKKLDRAISNNKSAEKNGSPDNVELSEREKEILISVTQGLTNKEIADKHFISIHTVISHRKNITRKTGIKTVSGLTMYALFNNLISQQE